LKSILTEQQLAITIKRLAHQVLESHINLDNTVLIGLQPRGVYLSDQIVEEIKKQVPQNKIQYGNLILLFTAMIFGRNSMFPIKQIFFSL
jgi:pyrimidine operon attenuation protein/uracil phosphoribosyltransferase